MSSGQLSSFNYAVQSLESLRIKNIASAYTIQANDLGTIINCTANTFTVSLDAAATLGAGFNVTVWNTSTTAADAITIDPNGAETIDRVATLILRRGEGMQIVCDGTNWQTGDKKTMRGYAENYGNDTRPAASGVDAIAIGIASVASGARSHAFGYSSSCSGPDSMAFGRSANSSGDTSIALGRGTTASNSQGTAIGRASGGSGSQAVTGSGAMALGGSYASGADSFAAAVANNTASFGARGANSVAIGQQAAATSSNSIALGFSSASSGSSSIAIGNQATASAAASVAIGNSWFVGTATASGISAIAIGDGTRATQQSATALGCASLSGVIGKYAYASNMFAAIGDAQTGTFVLRQATTDATATVLTTDGDAAGTTDQVILPNNSAYAFTGTVVARQKAANGTASAAWKVEGLIRREANAASTTLVFSMVTAISNLPLWTLALSADTTNGGLAVTATGAAATNIRWVATVQTSEVTFA
jgi:hypothetical protein